MINIYEVIFKERGKKYYFKSEQTIEVDTQVIVETEKGEQFGKVVNKVNEDQNKVPVAEIKEILRIATDKDYDTYLKNCKDATAALKKAKSLVKELNLDMDIINVVFTFDRKQLLFNFVADERIDFRELAKKLAAIYKTRIELRQIGARDKAREFAGIGPCGQVLCCSNFLQHIDSVSMNMAKNQGVSLNPQKINGMCSRLLCCLTYEDEEYKRCNKGLPSVGQKINVDGEIVQVISVNILKREVTVLVGNEKKEISYPYEDIK